MLNLIETPVKKNEIGRRKAKKKAIKILTTSQKSKVREILSSDENSNAETIQYAEPYRDTSKKRRDIQKKS